uniref:Uncharacterized protein n=1 Tax=Anguilla anguilla TaxID=7936 RepID=A0A0E9S4H9_ANGAN
MASNPPGQGEKVSLFVFWVTVGHLV